MDGRGFKWHLHLKKYDEMFVYGIGIEGNPKEANRLGIKEDLDTAFAKKMVIVLSKTPRQDFMD